MPDATILAFPPPAGAAAPPGPKRSALDGAVGRLLETMARERARLPHDGALPAELRPLVAYFRERLDQAAARIAAGRGNAAETLRCVEALQDLCDDMRALARARQREARRLLAAGPKPVRER